MLKYAGVDYDLNALFKFDLLKQLLEALAKGHNDSTNYTNENFEMMLAQNDDQDQPQEQDINKRVARIEKRLNNLGILEKWIKNVEKKTNALDEKITMTLNKAEAVNQGMLNNKEDIEQLNEKVNELNNKLNDYNVYTNIPEDDTNTNAVINQSKGALINLEQKIFKKFALVDEKIKKNEQDIEENKKKSEEIEKRLDNTDTLVKKMNEIFKQMKKELDEENEKNKQHILDINKKLSESIGKLKKEFEESNKEIGNKLSITDQAFKNLKKLKGKNEMKEKKEVDDNKEKQEHLVTRSDNDMEMEWQQINENKAMISALEKKLRELPSKLGIDELKEKIEELSTLLGQKLTRGDLEDIKEKQDILKSIVNELQDFNVKQNDINGRRNQDILSLSKKIENLTSTILLLQSDGTRKGTSSNSVESKGPDLSAFKEIINNINKQVSSLQNDCDEFRRYFTDILPMMKTLATITDLKNLEDVLKTMLEEYKLLAQRKFADKVETQKSIKLVDTQIKHFISEYIKKNEKGDNWMLATKPVGGYKCASCESYIPELTNKWEYLPWNKYPTRDLMDKSYRMGNGFSRMLQRLNLDVKKSEEERGQHNLSFSEGEEKMSKSNSKSKSRSGSEERQKRKTGLPHLKSRQQPFESMQNNSMSNFDEMRKEHELNQLVKGIVKKKDDKEPKVLKIYKKVKEINDNSIQNKSNSRY